MKQFLAICSLTIVGIGVRDGEEHPTRSKCMGISARLVGPNSKVLRNWGILDDKWWLDYPTSPQPHDTYMSY